MIWNWNKMNILGVSGHNVWISIYITLHYYLGLFLSFKKICCENFKIKVLGKSNKDLVISTKEYIFL